VEALVGIEIGVGRAQALDSTNDTIRADQISREHPEL
jgi:hypothetical protein